MTNLFESEFIKNSNLMPNNMCDEHMNNYGLISKEGSCDICGKFFKKRLKKFKNMNNKNNDSFINFYYKNK